MIVTHPIVNETPMPQPPAGNGASAVAPEVVAAAAQAADIEVAKKLAAIQTLGKEVRKKQRELGKQETIVAEAKSTLDTEREHQHKIERQIAELQDELVTLSTGKASERLPFGETVAPSGPEVAQTGEKVAPASQDPSSDDALQAAFDALPLAGIGVKPALADKLVADGIRDGKGLRFWMSLHPPRKISGVGEKAIEALQELMADKMLAMKAEVEKAKPAEAGFDDKAIKEDTVLTVLNASELAVIEVGQREGGPWAYRYELKHHIVEAETDWSGDFPTKEEAATAAADLIDESLPKSGLKGKAKKEAEAIRRELDKLDKRLKAAETPAKVQKQLAKGAEKYGELATA